MKRGKWGALGAMCIVALATGPTSAGLVSDPDTGKWIEEGFDIRVYAELPSWSRRVAFGRGGAFGTDMYAATGGTQEVYRIDPIGQTSVIGQMPTVVHGISLPYPGSGFGDYIYLGGGDPYYSDHKDIYRMDPSGNVETFFSGSHFLGATMGAIAFSPPGSAYGNYLYCYDAGASQMYRIGPDAIATTFSSDVTGLGVDFLFDSYGQFGGEMLLITRGDSSNRVYQVEPDGSKTVLLSDQFYHGGGAITPPASAFEGKLYLVENYWPAAPNDIYAVEPDGSCQMFARGFEFWDETDIVRGPNGALYVTECPRAGGAIIYEIVPEPSSAALILLGAAVLVRRRRKRGRRRAWPLVVMACGLAVSLAGPAGAQELGGYSFVPLPGQPHDVIHDAGRGLAYVSNRSQSQIDVVRLSDLAVLPPIQISSPGYGMSLTADANQLLVAFFGQDQVGVVDLASGQQVSTFDVPQPHPAHHPLRVDRDSEGRMYWQSGSTGGPFGGIYEFDPTTGTSTPVFAILGGLDMNSTHNREKWLLQIGCSKVAIWDAATQTMTDATEVPGFSCSSWATWIAQGALSADCGTIVLSKSIPEITVLDGSFDVKGTLGVGMSWGVFGDWADLAVMVELEYDETPSNRISILDTADIAVVDTLVMPEQIGLAEFNGGSKPIELMPDGDTLLAVGQTGLFLIDTSDVPEPACAVLLLLGAAVVPRCRGRRRLSWRR